MTPRVERVFLKVPSIANQIHSSVPPAISRFPYPSTRRSEYFMRKQQNPSYSHNWPMEAQ